MGASLALCPTAAAESPTHSPTDSVAIHVLPAPPAIDDPQMAPPPEAPLTVSSWDDALALVRAQSPDYLSADDNVARAQGQLRVALAGILPSLTAQGTFTHQLVTSQGTLGSGSITIPSQDVWGASATLSWPLGNPRAWYAIGTARRVVAAAKSDLADKRRILTQTVVGAMLATLAAKRVAELNRVGLRAALERLALTRAKVSLGGAMALDVDRSEQDVAAARALIIAGDEALRQSREALGLALGSAVAMAAPPSLDLEAFERSVATTCRLDADIEQRPDVAAARTRVEIAERAITDAELQAAPSVAVQSQFVWGSQVLYGPPATWNVAAVLNVPIWDGGARYGKLRDAAAAAHQAKLTLVSTRLRALVNVGQAERAVSVTAEAREVARQQRDLALRIDQRTREGYARGLGTSLDLVTSAQALRQAEINLALLEFQASQARAFAVLSRAECAY
jgi:outer membrane protein TolC